MRDLEPDLAAPGGRAPLWLGSLARRLAVPPLRRSVLHVWALSGFALAQPIFDLLGSHAEFFAVRGSPPRQIIVGAIALVVLPGLALAAVEALARLLGARLHAVVHLLLVGALVGVIALPVVKHHVHASTDAILSAAAALGVAATALYLASAFGRTLLTLLTPAPLVFLGFFLFDTPVEKLAFPSDTHVVTAAVNADTPVVVVIFDEFPETSLMDRHGRIDPVLYPHFAALARQATWYRNMTTVSPSTTSAVPAILTGMYPKRGLLPVYGDHPRNIFTLLGGRYRLDAFESETHLCPPTLCSRHASGSSPDSSVSTLVSDVGYIYLHVISPPAVEAALPPVTSSWGNFAAQAANAVSDHANAKAVFERDKRTRQAFWDDRAGQFESFLRSLRARDRTLDLIHVELPHAPWQYLPDGRQYALGRGIIPGREGDTWGTNTTLIDEAYRRHLLQVGFVDRLVGQLMQRLRATGMWDRSLVVVTADHGVSFRAGDRRRGPTPTNLQDIAFPPLFVKLPGQRHGAIVDRHVQTIDIVPTIADVLGVTIPWHVDGHSLLGTATSDRVQVGNVRASDRVLVRRRRAALRQKIALFGDGHGGPGIFGFGPDAALIGRPLSTLRQGPPAPESAVLDAHTRRLVLALPRDPPVVPSPIVASVTGGSAEQGRPVAVVVNGRVEATTRVYTVFGSASFAALVPEAAFHRGRNAVAAYWIVRQGGAIRLDRIAQLA